MTTDNSTAFPAALDAVTVPTIPHEFIRHTLEAVLTVPGRQLATLPADDLTQHMQALAQYRSALEQTRRLMDLAMFRLHKARAV